MTDAPKRIFEYSGADKKCVISFTTSDVDGNAQYVRADTHQDALAKAYAEGMRVGYGYGFSASAEGYNAENPFSDQWVNPEHDKRWVHDRDVMLANVPNKYEVKK